MNFDNRNYMGMYKFALTVYLYILKRVCSPVILHEPGNSTDIKISGTIFKQSTYIIMSDRSRIAVNMLVNLKINTIKPIQPIFGGNPDKASAILINLIDKAVG